MDWLDALQQLSLLIGIWVAIYGIDSWRREHTGKRQMELAEDTLALFYEAADAIRHIRHPASSSNELKDIERHESETNEAFEARRNASIVFVRYNQHNETFSRLYAMRYRFMAQIGKDKAKPFDELRAIVVSIQVSANALARLWPRSDFANASHHAMIEKHEAVFWEGLEGEDPVNPRLQSAINEIETVCRNVIYGKGTVYSVLNWRISRGS